MYLDCELENWGSHEQRPEYINCQLFAPDPRKYANDETIVELGNIVSDGFVPPVTFPVTLGSSTGAQEQITNDGNIKTYPKFTIVGTCSAITIGNLSTGEYMTLTISLTDTDTLIIDGNPSVREITLNGVKRMDLKDGDWVSCIPGDKNVITFTRSTLQNKKHCTVALRSAWI